MLKVRSFTAELVTALLLLAAIAALFAHTFSFAPSPVRGYPGAGFFPRLALIGAGLFTLAWIGLLLIGGKENRTSDEEDPTEFDFELKDYAISIAAVLAYVFALDVVGFEISTFLLLAVLLLPRIGPVAAIVAGLLTTAVLYGTFVLLLNVSVPLQFLPSYIRF
ncbi:tripartite tricarboxylate transporter TctB family protein [Aquamicrobium sp. LC103]|uniref:tripartite tricarboxylate transporter TctB family protein n=1 Tax=Aquamicrobium sp. LC103 TaxID=1120658 RepID=UPI00063E81D7|nr:tripartite tricarboxylate transporter TctB family protein [Aquamicrobium sp. LC103]